MQNPDELGDYFIDGDFSAELENYLHFWKKKKGGMTMNVLVALFSLWLIYRIIFVDKEDKRGVKGWWEYDPNKHKNQKKGG